MNAAGQFTWLLVKKMYADDLYNRSHINTSDEHE